MRVHPAWGEFFGTAAMVGIGCGSVALGAPHMVISLSFGLAVTGVILIVGGWSGAHINPAVSIAFWRDGKLEGHMLSAYIVAQTSGATTAAWLLNGAAPTLPAEGVNLFALGVIEIAITLALMLSILVVVDRTARLFLGGARPGRYGVLRRASREDAPLQHQLEASDAIRARRVHVRGASHGRNRARA